MQEPSLAEKVFNKRMLICVFTGFSSGLPLYVLIQLLQAWLRTEGIGIKEIGLFTLIQLPYTWKFLWAPLLDRYSITLLGRRRGWLLLTQISLLISIGLLGSFDPKISLTTITAITVAIAFFSATQDIVIDAYRREILSDEELGLGNSIHVNAYRLSGLIPGSLALILASFMEWQSIFWIVGAFMLLGIAMTLAITEPTVENTPRTMKEAFIDPFKEFFTRTSVQSASVILVFMMLYKLGDTLATALSTAFFVDLGFTLFEIGTIAKFAALWSSIAGGIIGGIIMLKTGINRALWYFGIVQIASILGFALLAEVGPVKWLLAIVISFEYLGVGLGTSAFVAFTARATSKKFAATQFALLTALAALPRILLGSSAGFIVDSVGYTDFFIICTFLAIPGMVLLFWVAPWNGSKPLNRTFNSTHAEH